MNEGAVKFNIGTLVKVVYLRHRGAFVSSGGAEVSANKILCITFSVKAVL